MPNLAVIGAGKWGSALHFAFSQKAPTLISSRTKRDISNFVSLERALECQYLVFVIGAQNTYEWLKTHSISKEHKILIASKGIDFKSGKFLHEIFGEFVPQENITTLSGPSFSKEVMQALPCAIVLSSSNQDLAFKFSSFFPNFIKPYISSDVIGSEVCGSYKNIIAIASGICDGLELGNKARASLIARGLVEIARFGEFFGAKSDTFLGLSGAGDLFLTASSDISRNYRVGYGLAKIKKLDQILEELGEVAEGVLTSKAVLELAKKNDIYTPVAKEVALVMDGKNPKESLIDLLKR
ncbi:MAG: NAD(P)H-dependent glycerol-3-phosphate dehydrogenase [Campylobacter sp.]|nr:NAD(P)H-dependent glycerol-3-phosphate dehydrogenase [Campylobacter sp.]